MAWGINTVFGLKPGYDVKLLESNGRGWECFNKTIAEQNQEFIIAVTGQTVTTDGGAGFANADIHKSIRADLIESTGDSLAYTLNTQGIPAFVAKRWGTDAVLSMGTVMRWDVTPPKDRAADAQSLVTTAGAITQLTEALASHGRVLDIDALCSRFGVPVQGDGNGDGKPDTKLSLVREAA
jgi:phage gp29-like protein